MKDKFNDLQPTQSLFWENIRPNLSVGIVFLYSPLWEFISVMKYSLFWSRSYLPAFVCKMNFLKFYYVIST